MKQLASRLRFGLGTLLLLFVLIAGGVTWFHPPNQAVLDGFCPVTLVDSHRWQAGDLKLKTVYDGATYLFAGKAEMARFQLDRARYAPVCNGRDVVSLFDHQRSARGRRAHGLQFHGHVLLFENEQNLTAFSQNPTRYMSLAVENYSAPDPSSISPTPPAVSDPSVIQPAPPPVMHDPMVVPTADQTVVAPEPPPAGPVIAPRPYTLDTRDVLGVFIAGILGDTAEGAPTHTGDPASGQPPAAGYPVPVREDGTISLPLRPPFEVRGLTLAEVAHLLRESYANDERFEAGENSLIVTLVRKRKQPLSSSYH